jgi:hypothetical protein
VALYNWETTDKQIAERIIETLLSEATGSHQDLDQVLGSGENDESDQTVPDDGDDEGDDREDDSSSSDDHDNYDDDDFDWSFGDADDVDDHYDESEGDDDEDGELAAQEAGAAGEPPAVETESGSEAEEGTTASFLEAQLHVPDPEIEIPLPWQVSNYPTDYCHTLRVHSNFEFYYVSLILYDNDWSTTLVNKPYKLRSQDGETYEGITDAEGFLEHEVASLAYYELTIDDIRLKDPSCAETGAVEETSSSGTEMGDSEIGQAGDGEDDGYWVCSEDSAPEEWVDDGEQQGSVIGSTSLLVSAVHKGDRRHPQRIPWVLAEAEVELSQENQYV